MTQTETKPTAEHSTIRPESTYDRWVREEGIPDIRTFYIQDLNQVPVEPWERMGGRGALIHLEGSEAAHTDAYVCEIAAGTQLKPQKHLFEETVYVVTGRGATSVWYEGEMERSGHGDQSPREASGDGRPIKQTFEWQ